MGSAGTAGVYEGPHGVTSVLMHPNGTGLAFVFPAGVDFGPELSWKESPVGAMSPLLGAMSCAQAVGGSGSCQD